MRTTLRLATLPVVPTFRRSLAPTLSAILVASCAAEEPIGADEEALVVCAAGPTLEGIDVSYYQGAIDWPAVAASGRAFAIARVGDGYFEDPRFDENWAGIRAAGMTRGVYQYFRPGRDATMQADILIRHVGTLGPGDLPPVLDVEATDGQSAAVITAKIHEWMDRVEGALGRTPMIYAARYFWNTNVATTDFASNPLWVANWGVMCPNTPTAWDNWSVWQYSATGRVPGITGDVDLNVFNGDAAALDRFASGAAGGWQWRAEYVAQSFPLTSLGPLVLREGDDVPAWIEVRNTGTETWNAATRLALTVPRDRTSPIEAADWVAPNRPSAVAGTVAPGETYRFTFTVHGGAVGTFDEHFGFVQEGVAWFADAASGGGGPPDEQFEGLFQVDPGPPRDAGAGTPDAGVPPVGDAAPPTPDSGADGDAGPDRVRTVAVEGDCGCRTAGGARPATGVLVLIGVALALPLGRAVRRRRQPARR